MKKTILLLTCSAACLTGLTIFGQTSERTLAFNHITKQPAFAQLVNTADYSTVSGESEKAKAIKANLKEAKAALALETATARSAAAFKKNYRDAAASWEQNNEGFFASFSINGNRTRADYNKKGRWLHTLTYLVGSDKAPADVAAAIYELYPSCKINLCVKVEEPAQHFYIAEIEDCQTFKRVVVKDGECGLVYQLKKAN